MCASVVVRTLRRRDQIPAGTRLLPFLPFNESPEQVKRIDFFGLRNRERICRGRSIPFLTGKGCSRAAGNRTVAERPASPYTGEATLHTSTTNARDERLTTVHGCHG